MNKQFTVCNPLAADTMRLKNPTLFRAGFFNLFSDLQIPPDKIHQVFQLLVRCLFQKRPNPKHHNISVHFVTLPQPLQNFDVLQHPLGL